MLDSFIAVTENAIGSLSNGRFSEVEDALVARNDLIPRLGVLLDVVQNGPAEDIEMKALRKQLRTIQDLDTRLRISLDAEFQRVGREMDLLDSEEAILTAYGHAPRTGGRNIDLTR